MKKYDIAHSGLTKCYYIMCDGKKVAECTEQIANIRADAIEKCAEIISKNMRCESCPVDCLWGTEQKCKDTLALYLKTQIEEQNIN